MANNNIKNQEGSVATRPPVVVILGHVDSGKTSILDYIRKANVAQGESGGITQHIGAYQIEKDGKKITFIDTPGHEAFSAMRARGAKVADIAILVIDISEGVQPQTKEAISHIKKAGISLIVALNKIDKPEVNFEKVKKELMKEDILIESFGGKIPSINVSAKTGQGMQELLEMILLVAEMENFKGDLLKQAQGVVIESYLDSQRGPVATLIVSDGILKAGDIVGTFSVFGKVKGLENFQGIAVEKALPSDPAIITGLPQGPRVGEMFKVFQDIEQAKNYVQTSEKKMPSEVLEITKEQRILNLILKTDVLGSIEAIEEILKEIPQERVILRILKAEVGEINESDIKLARSGRALVLGFRVKLSPIAKQIAEREKIKTATFDIIYDLVEGVRKAMERILVPETVRTDFGKVKVLAIFLAEKNRQIIGGKVIFGEAKKGASIEVLRNEEIAGRGRIINLQKNKKDAEKVSKGDECGILYEGDVKAEVGDILVFYSEIKQKGEL